MKIEYEHSGFKIVKWVVKTKTHRKNGPALLIYYPNGNLYYKEFYIRDKCHKETGPASIKYDSYGKIVDKCWFLYGEQFSKHEYNDVINFGNKIKNNKNLAIMNIKHPIEYIRNLCKEKLKEV